MYSFVDLRADPSAMFEGIDVTARRSCETRPYVSDRGRVVQD